MLVGQSCPTARLGNPRFRQLLGGDAQVPKVSVTILAAPQNLRNSTTHNIKSSTCAELWRRHHDAGCNVVSAPLIQIGPDV